MVVLRPGLDLDAWFGALARATARLLLLDYDGTLAPFVADPRRAAPYAGVFGALQDIVADEDTRVTIVTGRRAREIPGFLPLSPPCEVWGSHGVERLRPDGRIDVARPGEAVDRALREERRWIAAMGWADRLEQKPGGLALHWRNLPEREADAMARAAAARWSDAGPELAPRPFDGGLELRWTGLDKGDAVAKTLAEAAPGSLAAYLGDDLGDEPAFRVVRDAGLAVLARPRLRETAADVWLKPPDDVLEFLRRWRAAAGGRQDR